MLCRLREGQRANVINASVTVLLVDDYAIHEMDDNLRRVFTSASKVQDHPVLQRDSPWESTTNEISPCVLHDGSQFRMYYRPWDQALAYAVSNDGVHWRKPELRFYNLYENLFEETTGQLDLAKAAKEEFFKDEGRIGAIVPDFKVPLPTVPIGYPGLANNIIWSKALGNHSGVHLGQGYGVNIVLDHHDPNPAQRYKALHECKTPKGYQWTNGELCMSVSEDGLHFQPAFGGRSIADPASDTWNHLTYDTSQQRYLLYTRSEFGTEEGWREIRGHRTMSSPRVGVTADWTLEAEWFLDREGFAEKDRRQIYTLTSTVYHGVHIGFVGVLQASENSPIVFYVSVPQYCWQ